MILHPKNDAEWFNYALAWATVSLFRRAARRCFRLPYRITLTNGDGTLVCDLVHDGPEAEEQQVWVEPTVHIQQVEMFQALHQEMIRQALDTLWPLWFETPITVELVDSCGRREEFTIVDTDKDMVKERLASTREELQ